MMNVVFETIGKVVVGTVVVGGIAVTAGIFGGGVGVIYGMAHDMKVGKNISENTESKEA